MDQNISVEKLVPITWTSTSKEYTVIVSESCLREIIQMARKHQPNEVGTALVGRYSEDGFTAFVEKLAPLTPDSKGARAAFRRGVVGLKEFFSQLWKSTHPELHYVGEWHSHPNGPASPSSRDDHSQTAIANDSKIDCPEVILLILGGDLQRLPTLGVFVHSRHCGRIDLRPAASGLSPRV
jgi:proteasome lid subunit RPN8/RPN11